MNKINRGIVISYSFNKDYFQIGSAYQIHIESNVYRTAVLINCSDTELEFCTFDNTGKMDDLTISLDDIKFTKYEITKMILDYKDGQLTE
jgi:hypothetical protein